MNDETVKKRRGRPVGSKNKPKTPAVSSTVKRRGRPPNPKPKAKRASPAKKKTSAATTKKAALKNPRRGRPKGSKNKQSPKVTPIITIDTGEEFEENRLKGHVNPPGRPTDYRPEYDHQIFRLCLMGATDAEIAAFFEVDQKTIDNWKIAHPTFFQSMKEGKEESDTYVAASLYHRARGYSHKEDKIFLHEGVPIVVKTIKHYPPEVKACTYWLDNRKSDRWKTRREVSGDVKVSDLTEDELNQRLLLLLEEANKGVD